MTRQKPPDRRKSESVEFDFGGRGYVVTFSRYFDGKIMEAFLSPLKRGSEIDVNANDAATLFSIAIQNDSSFDEIEAAMTKHADGAPAGIVGAMIQAIRSAT